MSNNLLTYKGYKTAIKFSAEDKCLIGHILGIKDIAVFHAESVEGIRKEFEKAVDFYLESCQKMDVAPNKPFKA